MNKVIRPVDRDEHKSDLEKANKRIDELKMVVGNLASWLIVELGHENVKTLVKKLDEI